MDAKKLAGLAMAVALAVWIIVTAPPGTLAMIEVGLIGLLYVLRRRRQPEMSARMRKQLFESVSMRHVTRRPAMLRTRA
jgi:hypothetical protein